MKKIWSALLCLAMLLSLAACGTGGKPAEEPNNHKYFDTWDEMEQFIGLDLTDSYNLELGHLGGAGHGYHAFARDQFGLEIGDLDIAHRKASVAHKLGLELRAGSGRKHSHG